MFLVSIWTARPDGSLDRSIFGIGISADHDCIGIPRCAVVQRRKTPAASAVSTVTSSIVRTIGSPNGPDARNHIVCLGAIVRMRDVDEISRAESVVRVPRHATLPAIRRSRDVVRFGFISCCIPSVVIV